MKHQFINSKATHYSGITYHSSSFDAHFHNSYELICVFKGSIEVTLNTQSAILGEKDFLLISPCMIHSISANRDAKYFIAIITPDYIPDFFETHKKDIAYIFSVDSEALEYLKHHLFDASNQTLYQLKTCFYMLMSFADKGTCLPWSNDMNYDFILAINTYIVDHYSEQITRAQLAALTGYEEHYFSNLFRKNFQMGLRRYMNIYRISHAVKLLRETKIKIAQIALDSGFSSVKEFNNVFLSLMNETPSQYRKTHS